MATRAKPCAFSCSSLASSAERAPKANSIVVTARPATPAIVPNFFIVPNSLHLFLVRPSLRLSPRSEGLDRFAVRLDAMSGRNDLLQEVLCALLLRMAENLIGLAFLDDPATIEEQ